MSTASPVLTINCFQTLRLLPWLALCAYAGLFFVGLGDRDLVSSHEARAGQNAQMILDEGHWLVPRLFDRHLELQKPPLYYWLVAAIAWLRGGAVDVWAVRLPAALSALGTVLFLFLLGIQRGRPIAGFVAALVLASSLHFTWLARVGRIDMPLTMAITFALGGYWLATRGWIVWAYVWLGIGLLLKGPIALVLPAVVVAAYVAWHARPIGDATKRVLCSLAWGVPLMLAIAGPWYVWANVQTNNRLWEVFFWHHNVERGLGGSETLAAHPWWFYGPRAAFDLLPWSLAVPIMVVLWWRSRRSADADATAGLLWFGAVFAFLSCMSFKRADYLLPAYPGLALFLGVNAERWWSRRFTQYAFVGILLAYLGGWLVYLGWLVPDRDWPYQRIAQEIRSQTGGPVVFFRAESHLLAFHVKPVDTILEWENLQKWADRAIPIYFVMPEACARDWPQHLSADALVEVLHTSAFVSGPRDRPLVVLRNRAAP